MQFNATIPTTVFASDGTLSHCDRALACALKGSLSLGIKSSSFAVLVSQSMNHKLIDKYSKIKCINKNIGITYSGLQADYRILINRIDKIIQNDDDIYIDKFILLISRLLQNYTQGSNMRPVGVYLLVVGRTYEGKSLLFSMDPSGNFQEMRIGATGKGYEERIDYLEKRVSGLRGAKDQGDIAQQEMRQGDKDHLHGHSENQDTLEDCLVTAVSAVEGNVEIGVVDQRGFRILNEEEVKEVCENARQ